MTMGLDIPPTPGVFQITFSPVSGSHLSGRFFSRETPFCSGPRHWYQSLARAKDGAAKTSRDRMRADRAAIVGFITVPILARASQSGTGERKTPRLHLMAFGRGLSLYTPADESFGLEV